VVPQNVPAGSWCAGMQHYFHPGVHYMFLCVRAHFFTRFFVFLLVLYMNLAKMSRSANCRSKFCSRIVFLAFSIVMSSGMLYTTSLGFLTS